MTWFKVDDKIATHPKVLAAGPQPMLLWFLTGPQCAGVNTPIATVPMVRLSGRLAEKSADETAELAQALVDVGLWHDEKARRRCNRCKVADDTRRLATGEFMYHDWWDYQLTEAEKKLALDRFRNTRRMQLKRDMKLRQAITLRDRSTCRYCAVFVHWRDEQTADQGTFDHIDPMGPNTLGNVVVACRRCNGIKCNRSPEEAGMKLLPEPAELDDDPEPFANRARTDRAPTAVRERVTRETGRDRGRFANGARTSQDGTGTGKGSARTGGAPAPAHHHEEGDQ